MHSSKARARTSSTAPSPFSMISAIISAILTISGSFMPRVVTAGVPMRTPLVTKGERFSRGSFLEAHGLGGDDMLQRAALRAGENGLVDGLGVLLAAKD